jgi:hypothetical protein
LFAEGSTAEVPSTIKAARDFKSRLIKLVSLIDAGTGDFT